MDNDNNCDENERDFTDAIERYIKELQKRGLSLDESCRIAQQKFAIGYQKFQATRAQNTNVRKCDR
ncbi:hypothetical protein [Afifella sp. YEN Y35]|uniref:hypothetical protein n=1 Tax=Afifella sp. YEN Y35 TaxID=3388337 RepID=UPI0039DF7BEE